MITKPTVLILGAGASMPYRFPSGRELKEKIISRLNPRTTGVLVNSLIGLGVTEACIRSFREELHYSGRPSVDAFLEHRSEFLEVGKLSITHTLIQHEAEEHLFEIAGNEQNWYEYLFNKLNAKFDELDKNKLSIITFNYDRSLEYYLFRSIKSSYGKSEDECVIKLNKIPIIHVHGSLGALPWQGGVTRTYSPRLDQVDIRTISEQIKVIPETDETSPDFDKSYQLMKDAHRIYFLGFGYHEANLVRLKIHLLKNKMSILGTSYGFGAAEAGVIENKWGINCSATHLKILEFFREWAPLE